MQANDTLERITMAGREWQMDSGVRESIQTARNVTALCVTAPGFYHPRFLEELACAGTLKELGFFHIAYSEVSVGRFLSLKKLTFSDCLGEVPCHSFLASCDNVESITLHTREGDCLPSLARFTKLRDLRIVGSVPPDMVGHLKALVPQLTSLALASGLLEACDLERVCAAACQHSCLVDDSLSTDINQAMLEGVDAELLEDIVRPDM